MERITVDRMIPNGDLQPGYEGRSLDDVTVILGGGPVPCVPARGHWEELTKFLKEELRFHQAHGDYVLYEANSIPRLRLHLIPVDALDDLPQHLEQFLNDWAAGTNWAAGTT